MDSKAEGSDKSKKKKKKIMNGASNEILLQHYITNGLSIILRELVIYFFILTFILTKLEFGFYKSHIYGLFTPVKNTSPNKYS